MQTKTLALHVLRFLASAQIRGRRVNLQDLVDGLEVRRADVRRTVSALDAEGHLDATRMTLTLTGFALGTRLVDAELPPLRATEAVRSDETARALTAA
jgi:DNA-binding IclR family transcriptional regulator